MACPRRRFRLFLWQWRSGRGSRKCSHYGDSVKRALSLVIIVKILLVDLHDMRMQLLMSMFPLLILLPLLSIKLYLCLRMSTLSSFSIKQQSTNLFLLHHSPYLSFQGLGFLLLGYGNNSSETCLFIRLQLNFSYSGNIHSCCLWVVFPVYLL